jgi:hypothetical protein
LCSSTAMDRHAGAIPPSEQPAIARIRSDVRALPPSRQHPLTTQDGNELEVEVETVGV